MKRIALFLMATSAAIACNRVNPFLQEWDTPYGMPPFEQIRISDYIPALKAGIEQQTAEIQAIIDNPVAATSSRRSSASSTTCPRPKTAPKWKR